MPTSSLEQLIEKFRGLFPLKSKKELKDVFNQMVALASKDNDPKQNKNKQASMNLVEFRIAMFKMQGADPMPFEDIKRIFAWLDANKNGRVDVDEFLLGVRVSD
jgi:Ca2+-binding EF-hand superfamily protein